MRIRARSRSPHLTKLIALLVLVALLLGLISCGGGSDGRPSLIFFRSHACPYCKEMTPIVEQIKKDHRGELNVVFATLEEPVGKELADEHGILGYPNILLLDRDGGRVSLLRGVMPQPALEQAVEDLINGTP